MRFAITPHGIGKPVGWRMIEEGWPLAQGETFTVDDDGVGGATMPNKVLANDGVSLRLKTQAERDAEAQAVVSERTRGVAIRAEPLRAEFIERLRTIRTLAEARTFVNARVTDLASQREFNARLLLLIALDLRS
jgi:hypothetical protein